MKIRFNNTTILIAVLVVLVFGLWFLLMNPVRSGFNRLHEDITTASTRLARLESKASDPANKMLELQDVQERLAKLDTYFFSDAKALELFSELESLADTAGVDMEFRLGASAEGAAAEALDIGFTLKGSYAETVQYLQSLERLSLVLVMDELTMTEGADGVFTTTVTTRIFTPQGAI